MDFDDNSENQNENFGAESNPDGELFLLEDDTQHAYKTLKDCVIFLIDCAQSMISNNAITQVLAVAESFLKTKVITNEKDLFGLILYNTTTINNDLNFEGVNRLIPISPPDAGIIKKIKTLQQNTNPALNDDYLNFLKAEFSSHTLDEFLTNALWICHSELKNFDAKNFNRRIFLFTDNDNPMAMNINNRNLTIQRAKDMLESEIVIELFPMNFNSTFDMNKFYLDLIPTTADSNEDLILTRENCENRIRELTKRIRQKEVKKRTLGKCPLYLTKNLKFTVNFYATIKKAIKGRIHYVDAKTNKPLNVVNQSICKETGDVLYQNQIGKCQAYAGKKIPFTKEEMKQIKTFDSPGIKLMGFKSFDSIKSYYNVSESYFVYPDEYLSGGSSQLCDALIKQLIAKNKVAIVKFVPREGANIRFCALVPQKETFDEDYFQTPPGFNLIFLPYADEIRSNSDILKKVPTSNSVVQSITTEESDIAKKLIKKMNITFDCRNFENPSIQKFYSTLQALALGETEIDQVEDNINPNNEALLRVLNGTDEEFRNIFYGDASRAVGDIKLVEKKVYKRKKDNASDTSSVVSSTMGNKRSKTAKGMTINTNSEDGHSIISERSVSKSRSRSVKREESIPEGDDMEKSGKVSRTKSKTVNIDAFTDDKLEAMINQDDAFKLSSTELKEICRIRNIYIKSKINKKDIIEKISDYLKNK